MASLVSKMRKNHQVAMKHGRPAAICVDQLCFGSLLWVLLHQRRITTIWHFEPLTRSARCWITVSRWLGLGAVVRQVPYHIGQVRDETGTSEYATHYDAIRSLCLRITQEQFETHPLIQRLTSPWTRRRIVFYFQKLAERDVAPACLRMALINWMRRMDEHFPTAECLLLIGRNPWMVYLEAYARFLTIQLATYRHGWGLPRPIGSGSWLHVIFSHTRSWWRAIRAGLRRTRGNPESVSRQSTDHRQPTTSTIAIRYGYRTLRCNPTERSEFFWLNESNLPTSEVLVYDYVANQPLDPETRAQIQARGIRVVGHGPGIAAWRPTHRMAVVFLRALMRLARDVGACLARGRWISLYYLHHWLSLTWDYAYWYDFYATNRVRVDVGTFNTSVGQVLALDALEGISVAYQYSVSMILAQTMFLSAGEDVQCVFSSAFEEAWRRIASPVEQYVRTGYIYDSAFQDIRRHNRLTDVRRQLQSNGARFILCFFDENSINRWDINASDEDAARDYEYLLRWVLADPSLGILFKPKKSANIFHRLARLSELVAQAERTGRCLFLTSDTLVGHIFPAEVAMAADLCIGKLVGSTAALETRLMGVPTVLLDTEGLRDHPFRRWGFGRVIFDDWPKLRRAIEEYQAAPAAHPDFGDWRGALDRFDTFQDGQASVRLGSLIGWAYEALRHGASKQWALMTAVDRYRQRWGHLENKGVGHRDAVPVTIGIR